MKRNWLYTLFIALSFCAIGFTGCGDDGDEDDGTGSGSTSLNAGDFIVKTGGVEWAATSLEVAKDSRFTIVARKGTEFMSIRANDVVTGTYPLTVANTNTAGFNGSASYNPVEGSLDFCTFNTGQIIISEVDATAKTISGTFNFNCAYQPPSTDTESFTEGEFYKITYFE